jgi:hypothetical protein
VLARYAKLSAVQRLRREAPEPNDRTTIAARQLCARNKAAQRFESGVPDTADPLAGGKFFFVEALT